MQKNWEEVISECKQNNRLSQKKLFSLLLPDLNGLGRRYIYNPNEVQDVLQEAFLAIFRNIHQYDPGKGAFKTWASRIMINCCLKHNERSLKYRQLNEQNFRERSIDPSVYNKMNAEELLENLKKMPAIYFPVFNLFVIDGYSHKEIASILNIDEASSRQRLSRARKWIKDNFKMDELFFKIN